MIGTPIQAIAFAVQFAEYASDDASVVQFLREWIRNDRSNFLAPNGVYEKWLQKQPKETGT